MMKQVPQRRSTVSSGGSQASRKLQQEVTIVKHYQPNPIRKITTKFPEVKAFQDFPSTTRYLQLNPVFKLVDNFLASKQATSCNGAINGATYPTPMKNRCGCMRNLQGDVMNFTTKKSAVAAAVSNSPHQKHVRLCTNTDRIRANMNNINKTNERISLKNGFVPPCQVVAAKPERCSVQPDYVEQLKAEIKSSRIDYSPRRREDPDYITKLKDEIIVNKTRCIDEARAIINELKNEILNYRLRPKPKYSSSCSDLHTCCDKAVKTASKNLVGQRSKESPEKICACAAKQATCCSSPGKEKAADLERLRPCETLWRSSRGSFASSSDMDAGSLPSPGVKFEQKLEEANSLIEKVRRALRDIGKGIQHKPAERRKFSDINEPIEECSNDSKCVNMVCSFHGTCCTTRSKTATEDSQGKDLQKQKEKQLQKQKEEESKKQQEELQKQKEEALRKQMEEQLRKQIEEEVARQKVNELQKRLEEQLQKDELLRKQKEEELRKREEELLQQQELSKKKEEELEKKEKELKKSEERLHTTPTEVDKEAAGEIEYDNVSPSSMELLQRKLKAICEMSSESDFENLQKKSESDRTGQVEIALECNETEEDQTQDKVARSISTEFTESSSNSAEENIETVDKKVVEGTEKLLCDDEVSTQEDCNCGDVPDVERNRRSASSDSRLRKKSTSREEFEKWKGSRQESKAPTSCDFRKRVNIEDFEGTKRSKQGSRSSKSCESEERRSSKSCNLENQESSTKEIERRKRSKLGSRFSKSYEVQVEEKRRSKEESNSSKSADSGSGKSSSEDFEGRRSNKRESKSSKFSTDDEGKRGNKQSKSKCSTEASASKSAKLSIQVMPPVNIRGGLVMQRTLNLCIKPTGSAVNVVGAEHSNIGYREVKCEKEEDKESVKKCPEECRDVNHNCKYRVVVPVIEPRKSKSETLDSGSSKRDKFEPEFINALNESALLLYKSYQILDHKFQPSSIASTSSLAATTHKMAKNMAEHRRSITTPIGKKQTKIEDKADEDIIKQVLEHGKSPWEIGFYQTKSTQCSGSFISIQNDSINSCDNSASREVPVKDDSPVTDIESSIDSATRIPHMSLTEVINALKSSANAEMQKRLLEQLKSYDSDSTHSRRSLVVVDPPIGSQSPLFKFEPLTDSDLERRGPRKSILSNRISLSEITSAIHRHAKKSVSSSSTSTSSADDDNILKASAALIAADTKLPKKVTSSSTSTSTTTSSTSSSYNIHGSEKCSIDPSEQRLPMKDSPKVYPVPIMEHPEDEKQEQKSENMQVSTGATDSSADSSFSRERMNTITCFIKGLTGTSQEEFDKLKSNPSFPQTDLREWSTTQMRTLDSQHGHSPETKKNKEKETKEKEMMSKRSMYEVTLEEIMDSHEYGDKSEEDRSIINRERASEITQLSDTAQKKRVKDFQAFAKETMVPSTPKKTSSSSKGNKKKTSTVVMTMAEERDKFECGDEGSALTNLTTRNLPFYKRVLGQIIDPVTRQPVDMTQSDPIPMDDSVSEGEIKCKCSVSIGEVHPCKYNLDKFMSGVKHLKKHPEEPGRREFGDKSLRISRQRTQYNNWVAFYLQKRKPVVFNDSSSTSPINSSDK